jgi:hypothetical protein
MPDGPIHASVSKTSAPPISDALTGLPVYLVDAFQRHVLFLDLLRRRGNDQIDMSSRPTATVLRFESKEIMSGKSLPRPMNYTLSRIIPPRGVVTDETKRPVVVVDPRAGQGPGIGGFKADSEIGDALNAGHPVYFIGFSLNPEPGQQFLDVVEGQVKFFERVVALHAAAPRPFAIGNCQAGYQTLMVAMLRPDLFGPCLVAGAPMSFWQGKHGENPMRYSGGLNGGSWLTALTADLGDGQFDGTWLVLNFDKLGPANWLWGKQYDIYANIDSDGPRYLEFEKWWGDFIQLNGDELQYLVDNLFIGDKLTRNQLASSDGTVFDVRNVTSPIIVFTSTGDNISPPQETLGWILDLYGSLDDIWDAGQTIIYCIDHKIGHLALFVSTKVGAKEDEEFVRLMDLIDCLPPGLFEMVISSAQEEHHRPGYVTGAWESRFEPRSLDDIRNIGRNSPADDRAFAAVARVSALNLAAYRKFLQPWVRGIASQITADLSRTMNPLRLSYTMFADRNPLMKNVETLAKAVTAARRPAPVDNPYLAWQTLISTQITTGLDNFRKTRDLLQEKIFFGIYGSPVLQAILGIDGDCAVRPPPAIPPEKLAAHEAHKMKSAARLRAGGFTEALIRSLLYVASNDRGLDQQSALVLNAVRQQTLHLSIVAFKAMVRQQAFILHQAGENALHALTFMVPKPDQRTALLSQVEAIVAANGALTPEQSRRLVTLSESLTIPLRKPGAAVLRRRPPATSA